MKLSKELDLTERVARLENCLRILCVVLSGGCSRALDEGEEERGDVSRKFQARGLQCLSQMALHSSSDDFLYDLENSPIYFGDGEEETKI